MGRNALWLSLGAILLFATLIAVGAVVAPALVYDHYVWTDLYGPLTMDAHQCRTSAEPACRDLGPDGVVATDGFTLLGELTYGFVLVVLLYGLYAGIVKKQGLPANGWLLIALLPWVVFGGAGRALEDAGTFCRAGTDCDPSAFAYAFISPVIYLHIACYVIAAMLLGVFLQKRRHEDPRKLTAIVATVLALGVAAYGVVAWQFASGVSALAPLWFVGLCALAATGAFHWRATRGLASINLTVVVLGLPFAAAALFPVARWLSGDAWAVGAWSGRSFVAAGFVIFALAGLTAFGAYSLASRWGRAAWPARHGRAAMRVPRGVAHGIGWTGGGLLVLAAILANLPGDSTTAPSAGTWGTALVIGLALLAVFALITVGQAAVRRPHVLLIYASTLSLALVFAHVVDGLATWFAHDDPFGFGIPAYGQKHPFGGLVLGGMEGILFPAAKLVLALVVVWMLSRETKLDAAGPHDAFPTGLGRPAVGTASSSLQTPAAMPATNHASSLVGRFPTGNGAAFVLIALVIIGAAPGLRDVLRIAMGV